MGTKKWLLYAVGLVVLVADQLIKMWVRAKLAIGSAVVVLPGVVEITHIQNPGAAFSLLPHQVWLFVLVAIVVVAAVVVVNTRFQLSPMAQIGLGLLLGGALGNMVDRVFSPTHTVTDYVYFYTIHFPVFNLADASIDVGVLLLILSTFRGGNDARD
ncbi:signal peptidase II [Alicyclobacillus vulcanalis]|uniref:signal peptidase II n=1 Tax=Alicyclobacillus vulcanalis TaxID=252246 RepID=UPI00097088CA|nr:signal peptidase II [Alicyclobacillus vulcanalis]